MAKRTERAVDLVLAVAFLVVAAGMVLIVVSLLIQTRATLPAFGLVLFIVGLALGSQFGVRPAVRQGRSPLRGTRDGLRRLFGFLGRMVSGRRD
ncbi:MAG: hypothetical protein AAF480_01830 [Actinomycetota bacterium]